MGPRDRDTTQDTKTQDIATVFWVEKGQWCKTIRKAIDKAKKENKHEGRGILSDLR